MSLEEDGKLMYSTHSMSVPLTSHCDINLSLGCNWQECECTYLGTMFEVVKFS